jgi:hypothetical protein
MCQSSISLITKELNKVENDELLLKIKGRIALFILTMEVSALSELLDPAHHMTRNGDTQHQQ